MSGLAEALAKLPPSTQVAEAIRGALERYPRVADDLARSVWAHQFEMYGQRASSIEDITLFVQLWAAGR